MLTLPRLTKRRPADPPPRVRYEPLAEYPCTEIVLNDPGQQPVMFGELLPLGKNSADRDRDARWAHLAFPLDGDWFAGTPALWTFLAVPGVRVRLRVHAMHTWFHDGALLDAFTREDRPGMQYVGPPRDTVTHPCGSVRVHAGETSLIDLTRLCTPQTRSIQLGSPDDPRSGINYLRLATYPQRAPRIIVDRAVPA